MNFESFATHQQFPSTEDLFLNTNQGIFQQSASFDFPEISLFDEDPEISFGETEPEFRQARKLSVQGSKQELALFETDFNQDTMLEAKQQKKLSFDLCETAMTSADSKSQSIPSTKDNDSVLLSQSANSKDCEKDCLFEDLDLSSDESELPKITSKAIKKSKKKSKSKKSAKKSLKKGAAVSPQLKKFRYRTHKKQYKFFNRGHKLDSSAAYSGTSRLSNFPVSYEIQYQTKIGPEKFSEEDDYELDCEDWSDSSSVVSTGSLLNIAQQEPPKGISFDSLVQTIGRSRGLNQGGAEAAFHTFKSINGLQSGVNAFQLQFE